MLYKKYENQKIPGSAPGTVIFKNSLSTTMTSIIINMLNMLTNSSRVKGS